MHALALALKPLVSFGAEAYPQTQAFQLDQKPVIGSPAALNHLNDELILTQSASQVLQKWCDQQSPHHGLQLKALQVTTQDKPATQSIRHLLKTAPDEPIRFRHVQLMCGKKVFAEADNWYVPGRLDQSMNNLLNHSKIPFGVVVKPLSPSRINISSEFLPFEAFQRESEAHLPVLRHRAILQTMQTPICLVEEVYFSDILDFSHP